MLCRMIFHCLQSALRQPLGSVQSGPNFSTIRWKRSKWTQLCDNPLEAFKVDPALRQSVGSVQSGSSFATIRCKRSKWTQLCDNPLEAFKVDPSKAVSGNEPREKRSLPSVDQGLSNRNSHSVQWNDLLTSSERNNLSSLNGELRHFQHLRREGVFSSKLSRQESPQ